MALSPAAAVAGSQDRLPPCPFTDKLPLEIRRCIYRYFLSGTYNKREFYPDCGQVCEKSFLVSISADMMTDIRLPLRPFHTCHQQADPLRSP